MTTSRVEIKEARAIALHITADTMTVELSDGRELSVPLSWFPRLVYGTQAERENWEMCGDGTSFHWPDLDEDIGVGGLIAGSRSGESKRSFNRWLKAKQEGRGLTIPELRAYEQGQKQQSAEIE